MSSQAPDADASVGVVISSYSTERRDMLRAAASSVLAQSPHEVIVVIDHNDALLMEARATMGGVRVVPNEEARGLSGARNTGLRHSTADVIAFLDDDAEARPGWLAAWTDAFGEPRVVGAGGWVAPRWATRPPEWLPAEFHWVVGCSYRGLPVDRCPIRNPIGANMAFRREALLAVGGFKAGIGRTGTTPLGCEETECAIRVLRRRPGSVILHLPDARVDHWIPMERATWSYFRARCWSEGLSKAAVAREVGAGPALASERSYVASTLPRAFVRALRGAVRGDPTSAARAAAIVLGLAVTTAGYLRGRLARP